MLRLKNELKEKHEYHNFFIKTASRVTAHWVKVILKGKIKTEEGGHYAVQ